MDSLIPQLKCQTFFLSFLCRVWIGRLRVSWPILPPELLVVLQSDHQGSIASSAQKELKVSPSTLISRLFKVSLCMIVLWVVFKTFKYEKIYSTLPLENGKLNDNSHRLRMLGHFWASGQECNCTKHSMNAMIVQVYSSILDNLFDFILKGKK